MRKWNGKAYLEQTLNIHNDDMTKSASDGRDSAWGDKQTKALATGQPCHQGHAVSSNHKSLPDANGPHCHFTYMTRAGPQPYLEPLLEDT